MFDYKVKVNELFETNKPRGGINEEVLDSGAVAIYTNILTGAPMDPDSGVLINITLTEKIKGYMADYRRCEFWCYPHFGTNLKDMPDETQILVLEKENGEFRVVVPVVNDKYKCVLKGGEDCDFSVRMFSWYDKLCDCKGLAFIYADGENPTELAKLCVSEALKILNNGVRLRENRRYPEIFDYLGWCSWDSMQIRVSEDGLVTKCEEFKEKNIPVKWAIIDDMWAEIRDFYNQYYDGTDDMIGLMHKSAMYHFEADPIRFPNGLKGAIDKIKDYGIHVGMWHPTTGYWRGIDPDGEAYKYLKDYLILTEDGRYVPDWQKQNSYMYYRTMHDFFTKCGAEFVKIDNQSMTRRFYKNLAPVGKIAREFHAGMEASVGEHYDNNMINCMGMGSEDIWNRSVSPISRCSGDFQPENKEWFAHHIIQCAYNSLLQGQFYWCDWDMWWTDDGQANKNSLMRAVSGGPIYVSDKLERSNAEVFDPLSLKDGKILRCDRPALPTRDCMVKNPMTSGEAMKVQNNVGNYGIMAVLNIDEADKAVTAKISADLIDGIDAEEFAVYEYYSKEVKMLKKGECFDITLNNNDEYKLYIFAPVENGFAAIGRIDKFITPKTIKYVHKEDVVLVEDGPYAYVKDGKLIIKE